MAVQVDHQHQVKETQAATEHQVTAKLAVAVVNPQSAETHQATEQAAELVEMELMLIRLGLL
jgi:hypothetical protein